MGVEHLHEFNDRQVREAAERGRRIAADYIGGMTQRELAEKYGLAESTIASRLIKRKMKLTPEQRRNRGIVGRAKGAKTGRKPVWPDCPPELRSEYMRLRKNKFIPAADARRLLEASL